MIVGGVGLAEEVSLFFHYMKTHTIDEVTEKGVLDFAIVYVCHVGQEDFF